MLVTVFIYSFQFHTVRPCKYEPDQLKIQDDGEEYEYKYSHQHAQQALVRSARDACAA